MDTTMQGFDHQGYRSTSRISWGAILAGVSAGLAVGSLLNLLGLGLGLIAFNMSTDDLAKASTASVTWLILSGIAAMLITGWISGWFANTTCRFNGALHGFMSWGVATLLTFALMASIVGTVTSGAVSLFSQGISSVAKATPIAAKEMMQAAGVTKDTLPDLSPTLNQITQQFDQIVNRLSPSSNTDSLSTKQDSRKELKSIVETLLKASSEDDKRSSRQKVVNFLEQHAQMAPTEAEQMVSDWEQSFKEAQAQLNEKITQVKEKAKIAAQKTAEVASSISLTTFFILLINAIAAAFGGWLGSSAARKTKDSSNL